jgi:hypothetical protein
MIATRLIGGLGNQLFQYAMGRSLSLLNDTQLLLDVTAFENGYKLRRYSLEHFSVSACTLSGSHLQEFTSSRFATVSEASMRFDGDRYLRKYEGNVFLSGYWQSEMYFKHIGSLLRNEIKVASDLTGRNLAVSKLISATTSVSVHIRRGDYTNAQVQAVHGLSSMEYYKMALDYILSRIEGVTLFVFSDDMEWTRANFISKAPIHFVDHNSAEKDFEDLRLMSTCQHHIIANSTFSWWGAWLNPTKDKIVVAPRQWFATSSLDDRDIVPEEWIRL